MSTAARFLRGGKEDVVTSRLETFPVISTLFIQESAREREKDEEKERERE
jgi:hypothetical protein